ncbi:hypothetical protein BT96DRAFT_994625 [Gymnopus androsaceus JB14]|uniref:Uncharacterized protein n=1 Tax=Gymnopus androsaceus JB14 TaxID=1447944 RepID=A0A6A4HNS6_9AGAR|nr:hypothetical protein BT96DRAFT_994625 [Gymnopus androsaceus JB14]
MLRSTITNLLAFLLIGLVAVNASPISSTATLQEIESRISMNPVLGYVYWVKTKDMDQTKEVEKFLDGKEEKDMPFTVEPTIYMDVYRTARNGSFARQLCAVKDPAKFLKSLRYIQAKGLVLPKQYVKGKDALKNLALIHPTLGPSFLIAPPNMLAAGGLEFTVMTAGKLCQFSYAFMRRSTQDSRL